MPHALALHSGSHATSGHKSALRRMYESTLSGKHAGAIARAKGHAIEGALALRQGGESAVVGGALGAVQAMNFANGGLDVKKVPVDAVLGLGALAAGVYMAHDNVATDLRNAGAAAIAVFSFRKSAELVAKAKAQAGVAHGEDDYGEDPIIAAARRL